MKKFLLFVCLVMSNMLYAQQVEQVARTRNIAYSKDAKTNPIEDVRVKVETEERSDKNGRVVLKITKNGNNTFIFSQIQKAGYTLISPSTEELNSKKYALSDNEQIDIVLVSNQELINERTRIERNIRANFERQINTLIEQKERQDSLLLGIDSTSTKFQEIELGRDSLKNVISKLYKSYPNVVKFIEEKSKELSKIDYISLDTIELTNIEMTKEGDGDGLINYNQALIPSHENIAKRIGADISQMEQTLEEQKALRNFIAARYKNISDGFALKFQNDSSAYYLKLRVEIDPKNIEYSIDYAKFISEYFNDYDTALEIYKKSVKEYPNDDDLDLSLLYKMISNTYSSMGNYDKSIEYINKCIDIESYGKKANFLSILTHYNDLGNNYLYKGDYKKALYYHKRALKESEKLGTIYNLARCYNGLGGVYAQKGDYLEALPYHILAYEIDKEELGEYHQSTITNCANIGFAHYQLGGDSIALVYLNRALDLSLTKYGEHHSKVAYCYHNIANIYKDQKDYDKAFALYQKALEIRKDVLGENHPNTILTYEAMYYNYWEQALDFYKQADYLKAIEKFYLAINIRENILKTKDSELIDLYNLVAISFNNRCDYMSSLINFDKAFEIAHSTGDPYNNHISEEAIVMTALMYKNNYSFALDFYNKEIHKLEKKKDKDVIKIARLYGDIAFTYSCMGENNKCTEYYLKSAKTLEKELGTNHIAMSCIYNKIGNCYITTDEFDKATTYTEKSLKIGELNNNKGDIALCYNNFGLIHLKKGESQIALDYFKKSVELLDYLYVMGEFTIATIYYNLGLAYFYTGDIYNSIVYLNAALVLTGEDNPLKAQIQQDLNYIQSTLEQK